MTYIGVDESSRPLQALVPLLPPITFDFCCEGRCIHLNLDYFRNDWMLAQLTERQLLVPVVQDITKEVYDSFCSSTATATVAESKGWFHQMQFLDKSYEFDDQLDDFLEECEPPAKFYCGNAGLSSDDANDVKTKAKSTDTESKRRQKRRIDCKKSSRTDARMKLRKRRKPVDH